MRASGNYGIFGNLVRGEAKSDIVFNFVTVFILLSGCLLVLYPLYFIFIASISDPELVLAGKITLIPKGISFGGYDRILSYELLWIGYRNSVFYAVVGSLLSSTLTIFGAYSLSRDNFSGRKFFTIFLLITMFFNGGLIPTYILVKSLGLRNTYTVLLIVNGLQVMNIFIASSYFRSANITSLFEASLIDGCTHFGYLFKVLLPISTPIIIVMLLFYGVYQWNDFFRALIYLDHSKYYPLQIILKNLLATNKVNADIIEMLAEDQDAIDEMIRAAESMKYGIIIMATLPMLILYLLLQKYFVKGITMGSVKG